MPLIDPIALSIGAIDVTWYGIILGAAALVGLLLAIREGKRFNISPDFFMDLLLIGVPSAVIAARIYYVAFEWENYKGNFYEMIAIWHGGIAIHGALIGAVIAALIYTRVKKVNFWRIADIAAPSLIAGQMIGRWGNFVNQEAHGGPVDPEFLRGTLHLPDWIVNHMEIQNVFYHPTFLYESIWNLGVLLVLIVLRRRPWLRAGELFLSYFALYSVGRFFIEGVRTDSLAFDGPNWLASMMQGLWAPMNLLFEAGALPEGGGNVRMAQFISLLLVLGAIVLIILRRMKGYAKERYADPVVFGSKPADADGQDDGGENGQSGQSGQSNPSSPDGQEGSEKDAKPASDGQDHPNEKQLEQPEPKKQPAEEPRPASEAAQQDRNRPEHEAKERRYEPGNPFL